MDTRRKRQTEMQHERRREGDRGREKVEIQRHSKRDRGRESEG